MWLTFFIACLVCLISIYLPGSLAFGAMGFRAVAAVAYAPLFSVAAYAILAMAYAQFGMAASWTSLFLPVLLVGLAAFALRVAVKGLRGRGPDNELAGDVGELPYLLLFAIIGAVVTGAFFVRGLDGAASFFQAYDNGFHLSTIETFVTTGNFSSMHTGAYANPAESPFLQGTSFYPAAWHCLCSMLVTLLRCDITVTVNAVNVICAAIVFPVSMFQLISILWNGQREKLLLGAVLSSAVAAFPMGFLTFGPLYPNLLSMSLLPCVICAFLTLTSLERKAADRSRGLAVFLLGLVACAFAQPNTVFSAAVILAPYCILQGMRAYERFSRTKSKKIKALLGVALAAVIALIWIACFNLPAMQGVVTFNWPKRVSIFQGIVNALLMSFVERPVQLALAVLVFAGFLRTLSRREDRWMAFAYLFSLVIFVVGISTDGFAKQLLSGFWYTDPYRLAATCAVAAIPLAIVGAGEIFTLLKRLGSLLFSNGEGATVSAICFAVVLLSIFAPSFTWQGAGHVDTAFGEVESLAEGQNSLRNESNVLTANELEFSKEALELIPEGAVIVNQPNDGSAFLYPLEDANIVYRNFALPSLEQEKDASVLVRTKINEIATDPAVRDAVDEMGAEYVLLLDAGGEYEGRGWFWSYYDTQWTGLNAITDDTPGFELLLAKDDMRLYRIAA